MPTATASPAPGPSMPRAATRQSLSPKQARIFAFVVRYWGRHMMPPAIREIMKEFGIRSPNGICCHLRALHQKGWIVWESVSQSPGPVKTKSRGIVVPELARAARAAADAFLKTLE